MKKQLCFSKNRKKHQVFLIMKIIFTIIILSINLSFASNGYSQNDRLSVNLKQKSVREVFANLEKSSGYRFFYNDDFNYLDNLVSVEAEKEPLSQILDGIFKQTDFEYKILENKLVVVSIKEELLQAKFKLSGKVTDQDGQGMYGVTVAIKGTQKAVLTDAKGNFSIEVPNNNSILMFSYVGFLPQERKITGEGQITIMMQPLIKSLDEVIVVGYGTQKKSDITGSVTSVSKARLMQIPVTNVLQALEGSVAGVTITQTSSVPGSTPSTTIRGVNSISASTNPFIVLDGMPFSGSMNDINSNDIASIEILKDASAIAIYGTRGANGVILITSKRGGTGKPTIRYNGYTGFENLTHILKPMSGPDFVTKYATYLKQNGLTQTSPVPNLFEVANYNAGKTTDWIKEATHQGLIQDHNLSISGGAKDVKYFVSGDYLKQLGVVKGYQYNRANIRSNLDVNITDYLTAGTSLLFNSNNYDGGRANLLNASAMSPYASSRDATGAYLIYPMYPELLYSNPLLGLNTDRIDRSSNLSTNIYAELTPGFLKGLKYRLNASYTDLPTRYDDYTGRNANDLLGTANARNSEQKTWVIENILSYSKDFNKHHLDFTGLYSAQSTDYFMSSISATGFINDELGFDNIGAGSTVSAGYIDGTHTGSYQWKSSMVSQMGRINYSYNSRYLLTLTARRDGYSAFGANTSKYGIFPSMALGWNVMKENFMQNFSYFNNLKLRVSYGTSGNMAVNPNQTETISNSVRFPFNGVSTIGVLASNMGNANLNWESTNSLNVGLDLSAFKNRVNITVDVYHNKTSDILLYRNLPQITGYSRVLDNLGLMQNNGIEITLNTVNVTSGAFKWESNFNFSTNKNKILDLYGDKKSDLGNRWFIGQALGVIYDYQMVGVWQTGEDRSKWDATAKDGDLKFKDVNIDGKIDASDKVILGTTRPKWIGGMTNTFHYKDFHLSIFVQTSQGGLKNDIDLSYADEQGRRNTPAEIGYWTAENKSQTRPSLAYNNTRGYGYPKDNSFTRIKDVTFSYTFPKEILKKIKLEGLTLYASGRNLYTFTKWVGWDPENNYSSRGSGDWTNNYPNTRTIVFGMNISLQ
jgi:TonB-linked SusC/RagA family outer membrane protein